MQNILVCAMKRPHIRKLLANIRICDQFIVAKVDISFFYADFFGKCDRNHKSIGAWKLNFQPF